MKSDLLIPKNILLPIALAGFIFTFFTITFDLTMYGISLETGRILIYLGIVCNFITAIVLIIDVFKNEISAKFLWTLAFLFLGGIAGLYYLLNRDKYSMQE